MCKFVLKKRRDSSPLGQIRDILIDNISAKARGTTTITGHADQSLENIRISNVRLFMDVEDAKDKRASDAIRIENVKGLKLRDVTVDWNEKETEPAWQSALVLKNVSDFNVETFAGRQGLRDKDVPLILIENGIDGVVRNSSASNGTATFIFVSGTRTKNITVKDNTTIKAKRTITFENDSVKKSVSVN
jgi:hypothetical protein